MNVPQQPAQPATTGTPAPGGEAVAPEGAATPTLPSVIVATAIGGGEATLEGTPAAGGQENPQVVPTVAPQLTPVPQVPPMVQL